MAQMSLDPYPTSLGLFPQFNARNSETLVLKEKMLSFSGDNFDIKLVSNGMPLFQVDGKVMSLSGRKSFMDMQGMPTVACSLDRGTQ